MTKHRSAPLWWKQGLRVHTIWLQTVFLFFPSTLLRIYLRELEHEIEAWLEFSEEIVQVLTLYETGVTKRQGIRGLLIVITRRRVLQQFWTCNVIERNQVCSKMINAWRMKRVNGLFVRGNWEENPYPTSIGRYNFIHQEAPRLHSHDLCFTNNLPSMPMT